MKIIESPRIILYRRLPLISPLPLLAYKPAWLQAHLFVNKLMLLIISPSDISPALVKNGMKLIYYDVLRLN